MVVSSLKKYVGRGSKRQSGGGGGSYVSDVPYGPSFDGDATYAPSKNVFWDVIQGIGYVAGNIAYVDATGGNDSTGALGNSLRPFQTIGAAITAIGSLTNSAIKINTGNYVISDSDCPYGLKAPNTYYNIVCERAVRIDSYCSYGTWIFNGASDAGSGTLFGYPRIFNWSSVITGTVEGVSGYAFNVLPKGGFYNFEIDQLTNEDTGFTGAFRVGNGNTFIGTVQIFLQTRMYSRSLVAMPVLKIAPQSRCVVYGQGTTLIDNVAQVGNNAGYALDVENTTNFFCFDVRYSTRGQAFGSNTDDCVKIQTGGATNDIRFERTKFEFIEAKPTGKVIDFQNSLAANSQNIQFINCSIKSRQSNDYVANGFSLSANNNISIKGIDTYMDRPVTGAGAITNLISSGNGFMVDPNL